MKSFKYLLGAVAISAGLGVTLMGGEVQATVHTGNFGTHHSACMWYFDDVAGVFTVESDSAEPNCKLENANKSVWAGYASQIKSFVISSNYGGVRADWNMNGMFSDLKYVESFDFSGFNTSAATSVVGTFSEVGFRGNGIDTLDLSGWNTSNVIDMANMFGGSKIKKLVLGNSFDTSKVTGFAQMFYDSAFEELSLNFNTTSAQYMGWMFKDAKELKTLDISSFVMDGSSLISIDNMFDRMGENVAGGTEIKINESFARASDAEWAKYKFPQASYDVLDASGLLGSSAATADINAMLSAMAPGTAVTLTLAGSTPVAPVNPVTPGGTSGTSSSVNAPNTGASTASYGASSVALLGCVLTGILLSLASLPLILKRTKRD